MRFKRTRPTMSRIPFESFLAERKPLTSNGSAVTCLVHGQFFAVVLFFCLTVPSYAVDITLAWDANTEAHLAGYKVQRYT